MALTRKQYEGTRVRITGAISRLQEASYAFKTLAEEVDTPELERTVSVAEGLESLRTVARWLEELRHEVSKAEQREEEFR